MDGELLPCPRDFELTNRRRLQIISRNPSLSVTCQPRTFPNVQVARQRYHESLTINVQLFHAIDQVDNRYVDFPQLSNCSSQITVATIIESRGFITVYLGNPINYSRVEISAPYKYFVHFNGLD